MTAYLVPAVDRAFQILTYMRTHDHGRVTLAELCRATGIPRSSVVNILRTLETHGAVRYDSESKKYGLGWSLVQLGASASQQLSHLEAVRPYLHLVSYELDLTCVLAQRIGDQLMITDKVETQRYVLPGATVGQLYPLSAGAMGKAIFAFAEEGEVLSYAERIGLEAFTEFSITDIQELIRQTAEVRRFGYATAAEEYTRGIVGVAAPVFDGPGQAVLCIEALAPPEFIPPSRYTAVGEVVREAAMQMTAAVGGKWRGPEIAEAMTAAIR